MRNGEGEPNEDSRIGMKRQDVDVDARISDTYRLYFLLIVRNFAHATCLLYLSIVVQISDQLV